MKKADEIQKQFIDTLSSIRRSKNMYQNEMGSNQKVVSRMELQEVDPRLSTVIKYMLALGIDINDIFKKNEEEK